MKGVVIQFISAIIIGTGNYYVGYTASWSSYTLETLKSDSSPLGTRISQYEESLIGSLPMLGSFIATLGTVWLADNIGRKKTAILGSLFYVLSWAIIATGNNVILILVGRFIVGLASGIHMVVSVPFTGEISQTSIRGAIATIMGFSYCAGTLVSYVSGWLFSYQIINYLNLTLCVISVLLISLLKETPAFLLTQGKEKEALKSLKFYRGVSNTTEEILDELAQIKNRSQPKLIIETADDEKPNEKEALKLEEIVDAKDEISAWKVLWTSKPTQRAMVISIATILFLVFGGTIAVVAYAAQMFARASPSLSPHMCSVILAVSFAVGSMVSMVISDMVKRRTLWISSCLLASFFLVILATLLRWSWAPEWAIPAAVLGYCFSFQIGMGSVPLVQLSESFAPKMKSLATMLVVSIMCIANFVVLALFGPTVEALGLDGTFLLFGCECALAALYAYFFMKETKGVEFEAIQDMYARGYLYRRD